MTVTISFLAVNNRSAKDLGKGIIHIFVGLLRTSTEGGR